jgi:hypothetical protein
MFKGFRVGGGRCFKDIIFSLLIDYRSHIEVYYLVLDLFNEDFIAVVFQDRDIWFERQQHMSYFTSLIFDVVT